MQVLAQDYTMFTYDTDAFGLWKPDAAFRVMQEIAGAHSTELGFSREVMVQRSNCVWMLARAHFTISRYPGLHDQLHVTTWYGEPGRITCPRYVIVSDDKGEQLAAFATSWTVVDLESRRILPPSKAGLHFPPAAETTPPLPEPGRLRISREGTLTKACRAPQYSDLDVNGHMNNASYVSWILDLFPMEWHSRHRIQSLQVGYSAEARPHETVEMSLYREGLHFGLLGLDQANGHTVFEAQGIWTT